MTEGPKGCTQKSIAMFLSRPYFPWTALLQWLNVARILRQAHSREIQETSDGQLWLEFSLTILLNISQICSRVYNASHNFSVFSVLHSRSYLHLTALLPASLISTSNKFLEHLFLFKCLLLRGSRPIHFIFSQLFNNILEWKETAYF